LLGSEQERPLDTHGYGEIVSVRNCASCAAVERDGAVADTPLSLEDKGGI